MSQERPWTICPDGLLINIRLTPRADRDAMGGLGNGAEGRPFLQVRLRAVPEKGRANAALLKFLADKVGISASHASLVSGDTARIKSVLLEGDGAALAFVLEELIAAKG